MRYIIMHIRIAIKENIPLYSPSPNVNSPMTRRFASSRVFHNCCTIGDLLSVCTGGVDDDVVGLSSSLSLLSDKSCGVV